MRRTCFDVLNGPNCNFLITNDFSLKYLLVYQCFLVHSADLCDHISNTMEIILKLDIMYFGFKFKLINISMLINMLFSVQTHYIQSALNYIPGYKLYLHNILFFSFFILR